MCICCVSLLGRQWMHTDRALPDAPWGHDPSAGMVYLQDDGDRRLLRLVGRTDSGVIDEFQRAHGGTVPLVDAIDAGDVTFIGAAGLTLMLRCSQVSSAAGRPVVLSRSCERVDRLVQIVGMDTASRRSDG